VTDVASATLVKNSRSTRSTIALKITMAVTGLIFVGYVLAHMYGNLKAFSGEVAFNEYAEHLRELGEPLLPYSGFLWIARVVLLASLALHVYAALTLWKRAKSARTTKYAVRKYKHSSFASRVMRWGGVTLLLFIVWHLLNFTVVKINPQGGETNNPYQLMVDSFEVWWLTLIYLVAMAMLGLHLRHGVWSAGQTLGFTGTARARQGWNLAGVLVAVVVAGGFSLVPLAVVFGVIN
jgi:succinate dehydrogenase / fumarate reductase cytochrome b subunit